MQSNTINLKSYQLTPLSKVEMRKSIGGFLVALAWAGVILASFAIGYAIGKDLAER